MAGMLLLAKAKKEELGTFFKLISYLVILVSFLILICQGAQGFKRMCCHKECSGMESGMCGPGMMHGECGPGGGMMMRHGWMEHDGKCMEEMEMCKTMKDSNCCKDMKMHGCPMDKEEMKKDAEKK